MNSLSSVIRNFLLPLVILGALGAGVYYRDAIPALFQTVAPLLFYAAAFGAVGVSWHFNRNRFLFLLLPMIALFWALQTLSAARLEPLWHAASLLLPLHLLLFGLLKERGVFSLWGALRGLVVAAESAVALYLAYFAPEKLELLLEMRLLHDSLNALTPLTDLAVVAMAAVFFLFVLLAWMHHHQLYHAAFAGMAVALFAGFHFSVDPLLSSLAFLGVTMMVYGVLIGESHRLAFYDELTGLPGRRALVENMAKLGRKYALAMVDIDHFKKFNDTYGHDTGDDVLKMVAGKLATVGGGGKAYRYGGEEFTLLFPSKSIEEAHIQAEKVRQLVAQSDFVVRSSGKKGEKKHVTIHISVGVVEKQSEDKDPFAVMKRADNALYKAKKKGRNMVVKG